MIFADPHFQPKDHAARWRGITAQLRSQPECFRIALDNLARWEAWGRSHPAPILEWRTRIHAAQVSPAAMEAFLAWLAEDNHDSEPLKSCSPFVGLPASPVAL